MLPREERMSHYRRTAIRRLSVRRYRSISDVVLEDLPSIIVLYGPNGGGKSNILRAAQVVVKAGRLHMLLAMAREGAISLSLPEGNGGLELRPGGFRFGGLPEIRVSLEVDLGTQAR